MMEVRPHSPQVKVAASILAGDLANLSREVKRVEAAGADWIHLDVMDGHFVDNLTFGPLIVEAVNRVTKLPLDVHLMIENPEKYIDQFAQAGADYLTIHIETAPNPARILEAIRKKGVKVGLTLNPATPLEKVLPYVREIDLLLIMSVNPGFAGQEFVSETLPKIGEARKYLDLKGSKAELEVDGGINRETASEVKRMGATVLVAASAIFSQPDYGVVISALKEKSA